MKTMTDETRDDRNSGSRNCYAAFGDQGEQMGSKLPQPNPDPSIGARQMSEQRKPSPGFRFFKCEECFREWVSPSRDVQSPSGDECDCGSWVSPRPATTEEFDRLYSGWLRNLVRVQSDLRKPIQ